jgi:hypothetical protein
MQQRGSDLQSTSQKDACNSNLLAQRHPKRPQEHIGRRRMIRSVATLRQALVKKGLPLMHVPGIVRS